METKTHKQQRIVYLYIFCNIWERQKAQKILIKPWQDTVGTDGQMVQFSTYLYLLKGGTLESNRFFFFKFKFNFKVISENENIDLSSQRRPQCDICIKINNAKKKKERERAHDKESLDIPLP